MARDLLKIIKEMRMAPPKSKDDPRFDEMEDLAASYMEEGVGLEEEGMEDELAADDEAGAEAALDAALGGEEDVSLEAEAAAEGEETAEEEDELAMMDEALGKEPAPKPTKKRKPNPLMKRSYLDM